MKKIYLTKYTKITRDGPGKRSSEYRSWQGILARCMGREKRPHPCHHGRGITVCERWQGRSGFANFLADMGRKPTPMHTIDRYPDNDGNYEPGNCRWATKKEQALNRRSCRLIEYHGKTMTMTEWADHFGMKMDTLAHRLYRGLTFEEAVTLPVRNTNGY